MKEIFHTNYLKLITSVTFWGNILLVVVITAVTFFLIRKVISLLEKRIGSWAEDHENRVAHRVFLDVLKRTRVTLIFIASFLFSLQFIVLPGQVSGTIPHAWFLVLALQIALWLDQAVQSWLRYSLTNFGPDSHRNPVTTIILGLLFRALVWSVMILSILANAGVNITALVASLGVGGIAIALAVQTVLSDLFASLSIGIDKPFEIGDFVVFNDVAGTIEHIGLKTTRIRSLSGEQIVCANAILLQQTIHNYKRMQTRRIVFSFGVPLATSAEQLRKIGPMIEEVIGRIDKTRFDRAHLASFESDRIMFEVVHILKFSDYNQYMDIQQEINLRIKEYLEETGIGLAGPHRFVTFENSLPQEEQPA
ncbi:small-conductance mechanosensitive channel [Erwinia persicina]|uniref:Mechanosensitive ion channel family protein n=1 Tax=Erwinia aeris TaxID=3239803 RepID=A0ABV4EAJ9_9GAMM|nr:MULTISPECIES: mechanosensitive ion channel family protein [unclassified Erwinia]MCP1437250.1 small-conductance mechanosensitive channel [Erwinia persicina]MDN4627187.1 mechanosensitive ion channel family protein [Erwinia sp. PsM31]MDN8540619.1 mechanosensitive ion channel family protein [Erwinia sp. BC051422]